MLNLVIGFNQIDSGSFKIDGIDADKINMRSYRKFISVVPQSSILFSGTIKENITYGRKNVTKEMLDYAVKAARLESVIEKLPDGINTMVGEHGAKLSGGQRQRISIARAIIRNPRVIIFDEATSALDNLTQKRVSESLDSLKCTRIVIAHKLSTIKQCDRILVLDGGKITEDGTYDELIAQNGVFAELVERQRLDT